MQKIKKAAGFILSRSFYLVLGVAISASIYFAQAAWNTTVTDGTPLTPTLWNDLVGKVEEISNSIGASTTPVYRCPKNTTGAPGEWASFGCVGQLSTDSTCTNYAWNSGLIPTSFTCSYVGILRLE